VVTGFFYPERDLYHEEKEHAGADSFRLQESDTALLKIIIDMTGWTE